MVFIEATPLMVFYGALRVTSFVGYRAVWCDVGHGLPARDGRGLALHVVQLPAVVIRRGTIRERQADLRGARGRHRGLPPASARLRHLHAAGRVRTAVHAPLHTHARLRGRGTVPDRRGFQGLADGPERPLLGTVPVGGVDLHVRTVRGLAVLHVQRHGRGKRGHQFVHRSAPDRHPLLRTVGVRRVLLHVRTVRGLAVLHIQRLAGIHVPQRHVALRVVRNRPPLRLRPVRRPQPRVRAVLRGAVRHVQDHAVLQRGRHRVRAVLQIRRVGLRQRVQLGVRILRLDRDLDGRALAARGRGDRGLAGLRPGGDHAGAHHVRDARVRARPRDLAVRRVVGLDRRGQLRARPGLQGELAVRNAITRDRHRLDRDRIISHSNNDRSRLTASSRCNRCSASLHSGDLAVGHLSHRTIRAGPRDRLVRRVRRGHGGRQLHARSQLQAQLAVAHTGTRNRDRRDRNRLRGVAVHRTHRGGRAIPADLAGEFDAGLAGARGLRSGTVGEDYTVLAFAQIRYLVLVGAGLRTGIVGGQLGHFNARPVAIVLGRGVVVHVGVDLVPAGRLGGVDHVGDFRLHAGDRDGDGVGFLVRAGSGGDLHRSRLKAGNLALGIDGGNRSVGRSPSHGRTLARRIGCHIRLELHALRGSEIHGSVAGNLDGSNGHISWMARLFGVNVAIRVQTVLFHILHAIFVARAGSAVTRVVSRIAILGVRVRVLDGFAVCTGALHCDRHHFIRLGLAADFNGVAVLEGTGLTVGSGIGGVGGLVRPESDRLRFARDGALVRICLGGGDLAGTGLIGKRRDGLALHRAGDNLAAGNGDGGTGHFIRISAVGQLGGLAGKILVGTVRIGHYHAVLSCGTGITLDHQAVVVAAVGDV